MSLVDVTISINDQPAPDLFVSLISLEVEEDHRMAAMFRIKAAVTRRRDGLWTILDDERVQLWSEIKISVNLSDEDVELISGYITQLKPHLDPVESSSFLEIWGMDATSLMSVEEKIKDWPNKSDSEIARAVFKDYKLNPEVEDVTVIHNDAVSTIIQRDTDIQFLKRLARRNGFECYVRGKAGFFGKPRLNVLPQPVLSAHFGSETNLVYFDARVNALRPTSVEMHQIDTIGKQVQSVVIAGPEQRQLGRQRALSVRVPDGNTAHRLVKHAVATGPEEMETLCRALVDESEWFTEAQGEIDSLSYGAALQAKKLVPIKGVGEIFSGIYYVTNVKHVFDSERYVQQFAARRNAMSPLGPGDFMEAGSAPGAFG